MLSNAAKAHLLAQLDIACREHGLSPDDKSAEVLKTLLLNLGIEHSIPTTKGTQ